jgi:hypothetical protein
MLKRRERDSRMQEHASLASSVQCKSLETRHPLAHGIMHVSCTMLADEGRLLHRPSLVMLSGQRGMRANSAIVTDPMEQEHNEGMPCGPNHFQVISEACPVSMLSILVTPDGSEV